MQQVRFLPRFDDGNGWFNILPPPPPARELEGDLTADWLVIGAGYADPARGRRILALHRAGQAELDRLVHEHGIRCRWSRRGKYMVAVGARARKVLDRTQEFLTA